jgi:hypothetical protein
MKKYTFTYVIPNWVVISIVVFFTLFSGLVAQPVFADETITFSATTADYLGFGRNVVRQLARCFVPSINVSAANPTLDIFKLGSPTDNMVVSIQGSSGGLPDGTDLGSVSKAASTLGTSAAAPIAWGSFAVTLTAGTTYCLVATRSGSLDDTHYYGLSYQSGTGTNNVKRNVNGTWSAFNDADFQGSLLLTAASVSAPPPSVFFHVLGWW